MTSAYFRYTQIDMGKQIITRKLRDKDAELVNASSPKKILA